MSDLPQSVSRAALEDHCRVFGEAASNLERIDAEYKAKLAAWEEDNAALVSTRAALKELVKDEEAVIRDLAVSVYLQEDGVDRNVGLGVSIEQETVAVYDPDDLRRAALTQMPSLLMLNVKAVEQLALAIFAHKDLRTALMVSLPLEAIKRPRAELSRTTLMRQAAGLSQIDEVLHDR